MTQSFKYLASAAIVALALPAQAQQGGDGADAAQTWRDVSQPSVRVIQRAADGTVLFDSANAPGATDPDLAAAIQAADAPHVGQTDATVPAPDARQAQAQAGSGYGNAAETAEEDQAKQMQAQANGTDASEADTQLAATGDDGTPRVEDGALADQGDVVLAQPDMGEQMPGASVPFDLQAFAQQMFEQGYRQGYVSGMTAMRAEGARQMMRMRREAQQPSRAAFARQAGDQRQGMRQALPGLYDDGQGGRILVVPAGMTPQEFLEQMSRRNGTPRSN